MPMYKTTAYKMKRDRAPPSKVIPYFYKLLLTIRALHDLHVSHGDLKPNNVLTDTKGNPVYVQTKALPTSAYGEQSRRLRLQPPHALR